MRRTLRKHTDFSPSSAPLRAAERGSVAVVVLGFILVLLTTGMAIVSIAETHARLVKSDGQRYAAMALADAGAEKVMWRLTHDATWRTISQEQDVALAPGAYYLPPGGLRTDASGNVTGVRMQGWVPNRTTPNAVMAEVFVEMQNAQSSPFKMAILTKDGMTFSGSFYTDSYDSSNNLPAGFQGTFGQRGLGNGDIGTISTTANAMNIGGNPQFYGSINYPTGYPSVVKYPGNWWRDDHSKYKITQAFTAPAMPDVTMPPGVTDLKPINGDVRANIVLKPGCCNNAFTGPNGEDYIQVTRTDNTVVNPNTLLAADGLPYIPAGDYHITSLSGTSIVTSINTTNNHVLRFGPGQTRLYIDGNLTLANSGKIISIEPNGATSLKSTQIQVFGLNGCTSINMSGDTPLVGGLYAPNAAVTIGGSCRVLGSVVAKSANLSGGAWVYYDESFSGGGGGGSGGGYKMTSWTQTR